MARAVELGADLLGFVLAPSPREVKLSQLSNLVAPVPASVLTVGVVVNPSREFADQVLSLVDRIQFHGDETPEFCARYGRRGIKAFRIRSQEDFVHMQPYQKVVGAYLLDSYQEGVAGGTGHRFCWDYLNLRTFPLPTFLAGGLKPENLNEALRVKAVVGVDVSSGLEASPGVKDPVLMDRFFRHLRGGSDPEDQGETAI